MQTLSHHETPHGHDGHHFVRFYDDEELLADEIAQHLLAALTQQGSAIVIATPARVAAILPRLRAASAVAPDLLARLVVRDAADTLAAITTDGWPDDDRFDAVVGTLVRETGSTGAPLHAYGEMVALLCAEGRFEAAVRLEQLWNTLAERTTFSLFCAYPWTLFPTVELANSFAAICQAHTHACSQKQPAAGTVSRPDQFRLLDLERKALALDGEVRRRRDAERMAASSEADLADFLDNAAEGIHRVGADGTILWANKAELALLGYRWEEYVGRHIGEFHADPHVIDHILATLQKGETIYDQPARLRCKDGSIRHVLIHSNACFENGELRYTRCFTRDATERHERDALLATLTEANRNKDQFLAMLGHELRNPLSPILLALEMMELRGDNGAPADPAPGRPPGAPGRRPARHRPRHAGQGRAAPRAGARLRGDRQGGRAGRRRDRGPLAPADLDGRSRAGGVRRRRAAGPGTGQPVDQRGPLHAAPGPHPAARGARCGGAGPYRRDRQRPRHGGGRAAPGLRFVLPGRARHRPGRRGPGRGTCAGAPPGRAARGPDRRLQCRPRHGLRSGRAPARLRCRRSPAAGCRRERRTCPWWRPDHPAGGRQRGCRAHAGHAADPARPQGRRLLRPAHGAGPRRYAAAGRGRARYRPAPDERPRTGATPARAAGRRALPAYRPERLRPAGGSGAQSRGRLRSPPRQARHAGTGAGPAGAQAGGPLAPSGRPQPGRCRHRRRPRVPTDTPSSMSPFMAFREAGWGRVPEKSGHAGQHYRPVKSDSYRLPNCSWQRLFDSVLFPKLA